MQLFKKLFSTISLSFITLLLSNCASFLPTSTMQTMSNDDRRAQLLAYRDWSLNGVIGIRTTKDAYSANYYWQQTSAHYNIELAGPLGAHATRIQGQPGFVELKTSDGKAHTANSPEDLLQANMGWQLPLNNLVYWVRGLVAPSYSAQTRFDFSHHLSELQQQGWLIQYIRYTKQNNIDLPTFIMMQNNNVKVKLIIHAWNLGT